MTQQTPKQPSKEWCEKMAQLEGNQEISAGNPNLYPIIQVLGNPMETAPRDGTLIDVWCIPPEGSTFEPEEGGIRLTDVSWHIANEIFPHTGWVRLMDDGNFDLVEGEPSSEYGLPPWEPVRWMPSTRRIDFFNPLQEQVLWTKWKKNAECCLEVVKQQAAEIEALKAHNAKLREALERAKNRDDIHLQALDWLAENHNRIAEIPDQSIDGWISNRRLTFELGLESIETTLSSTEAQSLAEIEQRVVDRCVGALKSLIDGKSSLDQSFSEVCREVGIVECIKVLQALKKEAKND